MEYARFKEFLYKKNSLIFDTYLSIQLDIICGILLLDNSHRTLIQISLSITLYLYFTYDSNFFIPWEKLFAYLCSHNLDLKHYNQSR